MIDKKNFIHGEFVISLEGDVVVTTARGPWNEECVVEFGKEYAATASPVFGRKWADIVQFCGESLLVPEAEELLKLQIRQAIKAGLSHVAILTSESTVRTIAHMQINQIYYDLDIEFQIFDNVGFAVEWLNQQGFPCEQLAIESCLNLIEEHSLHAY